MIARVRKNDTILVLTGKDKGKQGVVLDVLPKKGKVLVKGVAIVTRHVKARSQGEVAGIKKKESYINLSNVMPIDPTTKKPCRINSKVLENGKRVRISNSSKEMF